MDTKNPITIVIPTRNRGYTLERVLPSYYQQKYVSQIVFVNDNSTDHTLNLIEKHSKLYPDIKTKVISTEEPKGSSYCRNQGAEAAVNEYVLFGEDDAYLSENYSEVLLNKLMSGMPKTGIVSGRLVLMSQGENPNQSIKRFGNGNPKKEKLFRFSTCSHVPDAYFEKDVYLPLTHALILTTKTLLLSYPFDTHYSKGNAHREESDFQMHAYTNGYDILVTNETHCMHLHPSEVKIGGNRTPPLKSLFYKIRYTNYFYDKYYDLLKKRCRLLLPKFLAKTLYAWTQATEFGFAILLFLKKKIS